jgi:hypothetical protein
MRQGYLRMTLSFFLPANCISQLWLCHSLQRKLLYSAMIQKVLITEEAATIVKKLQEQYGELMFHQSGGCCDGSAPMCFAKG